MNNLEMFVGLDHFNAEEFNEPAKMDVLLLRMLDKARESAGVPFKITSDFRTDDTPDEIDSSHELGFAVDIRCPKIGHGKERWAIINGLIAAGFTRIGIYDKHIHGDVGDRYLPGRFPANVIWHGISQ